MTMLPRLFVALLALVAGTVHAQDYVPADLDDWKPWVLKDREYRDCPFYFDGPAAARADFACVWPGRLQLDVTTAGARFSQLWTVQAETRWVELPGSPEHWPDQVTANDRAVEVIARNNVPSVRLAPGTYRIEGRFAWDNRPGMLRLPPASGLLTLRVDGREVVRPEVGRGGVFLAERQAQAQVADTVRVIVHRLVADDIPTRLVTQLRIDVSGGVREEQFGPLLPDGFTPMSLQSALPARLEADGKLRLQVRPGSWTIDLSARAEGVADAITRPPRGDNLPDTEIWSYQANARLRVTAPAGLPAVDPAQAEVPGNWAALPSFSVAEDATLLIEERSRGLRTRDNELTLQRTIWFDFEGRGLMVRDAIGGVMRSGWRLDMAAPFELLLAAENGENLLITRGEQGRSGVELRHSDVSLDALGRSETQAAMPVTGWDARFGTVNATLNLPPGHRLLAALGVDRARGSWVEAWQLLDFFLLLLITIAAWRLFNPVAGGIALVALALSFHEPLAPTWLWLNLLAAIALLRVTPHGRLHALVRGYQLLSAAVLLLALVPFIASQLRVAIYPQLEPQYHARGAYEAAPLIGATPSAEPAAERPKLAVSRVREDSFLTEEAVESVVVTGSRLDQPQKFARYAPNAIVQAGSGIPSWRWNSHRLEWSGPVEASQSMRFVVLGRWSVTVLRVLAVALLLALAAVLAAEITQRRWTLPGGVTVGRNAAAAALVMGLGVMSLAAAPPAQAELPDADLLRQLEERLLEPPDCVPRCAEIAQAEVTASGDRIAISLGVHAVESVALPLPGSAEGWRVDAVAVDGAGNTRVLRGRDGALWLLVTAGRHRVSLRGTVPEADSIEIPFPTPPRVITADGDGWLVDGIRDRRLVTGSLRLMRERVAAGSDAPRWESSRFPAFAHIERTVAMDVDWTVTTVVTRIAPATGALMLEVPLLDGESIVSGDFEVVEGRVRVSLGPQQHSLSWTSKLPAVSPLVLTMPADVAWQETWAFQVGNIWSAAFDGVPQSNLDEDAYGVRVATFDPRAAEQLTMVATRPEGAGGTTLAFDAVDLEVTYGQRSSDARLQLDYRSTRGDQHVVTLPPGAELTIVEIDGQAQSVRAEDGRLTLPVLPGSHTIVIGWRTIGGMGLRTTTPAVDIAAPSNNITLRLTQPRDRWLLATTGPKLGPAVLYWSELAVLVLLAGLLGRFAPGPLRSREWLLLGLGFSTFNWPVFGIVVAWLLFCGAREGWQAVQDRHRFNAIQVVTAATTVLALLAIIVALPQGLLGTPDMHVAGQGQYGGALRWFADRSAAELPTVAVFTLPLWVYKGLILVWALWLSFALLRWLPWVWRCFSQDGLWRGRNDAHSEDS